MSATEKNCRSCGSTHLKTILSLGCQPLANDYRNSEQLKTPQNAYPLELVFCPNCSLVQITETVDPNELFSEYLYFSSYSETMLHHANALVTTIIDRYNINHNSLVIEVASNDGYLLQYFKNKSIPVLGIDPAQNIVKIAEERGIPTRCAFFNHETARQLCDEGFHADIILGLNVLAHLADLSGFVEGVREVLKKDGTAVFEVPYVKDMISRNEFDTIYHEHLCYYSLISLRNLFNRHALEIVDVEQIHIHGGSLMIFVQHRSGKSPGPRVETLLAEEYAAGLDKHNYYIQFADEIFRLKEETVTLLKQLKDQGKHIVAYGAAAKGSTLLNFYGIDVDTLEYVGDKNPYKQGKFMSGTKIPIVPPEFIDKTRPDYILILPWNLKDEIMDQQRYIRKWGGQFIIPIPHVQVV